MPAMGALSLTWKAARGLVGLGRLFAYIRPRVFGAEQGKGNPMHRDPAHDIHTLLTALSAFLLA
jgi:hypothetical protein